MYLSRVSGLWWKVLYPFIYCNISVLDGINSDWFHFYLIESILGL